MHTEPTTFKESFLGEFIVTVVAGTLLLGIGEMNRRTVGLVEFGTILTYLCGLFLFVAAYRRTIQATFTMLNERTLEVEFKRLSGSPTLATYDIQVGRWLALRHGKDGKRTSLVIEHAEEKAQLVLRKLSKNGHAWLESQGIQLGTKPGTYMIIPNKKGTLPNEVLLVRR